MKRTVLFVSTLLASALAGGVVSFVVVRNSGCIIERQVEFAEQKAGAQFTAYDRDNYPDLTYAAENAVKAVVNIEKVEEVKMRSRQEYDPFFEFFGIPQQDGGGQQRPSVRERRSGGSGVIISPDGYIVTNNHVAENASKLKVKLNDGRTFDARIIGSDPTTDLALIKIDATDLPTLAFGDSDELRLGEWVLAIGSPFDLQSTITAGIVSAKARNLDVIPSSARIESFIQTDAAVNPGNSGGALVNVRGELVGINTVIKSPTGSYAGYSFAIPAAIVKKVVVDLKEYGVVQRALLGITFRPVDEDFIESEGKDKKITEQGGVYVEQVLEDGAAKAAGIKAGDVITEIDGVKINSSATLLEQIGRHRPNDKIKVTLKRGGEVKQIDVVLRNKAGKEELLASTYVDVAEALGGAFGTVDAKTAKQLKIDGGIQVKAIKEGGVLSQANVKRGYIITEVNGVKVNAESDLAKITTKVRNIEGVYPDGRWVVYSLQE